MSDDERGAVTADRSDDHPTGEHRTGEHPVDSTEAASVEALGAENHRLRTAYASATASKSRRSAVGLAGVGVVALLGALALPSVREVLLALGGTAVVLGVLSVYLAPETDRPEPLDATIYGTLATNERALCTALGLADERMYVPVDDEEVRLFVPGEAVGPRPADSDLPSDDALSELLVGPADSPRGAAFDPTGATLVAELEQSDGELADSGTKRAAERVSGALVDRFALVDGADVTVDATTGEARVTLGESPLAPLDGFDHPAVSALGVGLARSIGRPVSVTVETDDGSAAVVTCQWAPGDTDEDGGREG